MEYIKEYERWLERADEATKKELLEMSDADKELYFHGNISFGTAGLRGTMNPGTNAMNVYTVARATQGLAELIISEGRSEDGVVISYDSRNNSELFARTSAEVLCGNGVKTYLFESLRPTPVLSFSVRYLRCAAGINITASHNPKQYNGYKAYWDDGAQLSPALADKVSSYISKTDIFDGVKKADLLQAEKSGLLVRVGEDIDRVYLQNVREQLIDPEAVKSAEDLNVIYSPLNGTGYRLVPEVLRSIGIKNLYIVPEQAEPDGDFPSTPFPNPEFPQVFEAGKLIADRVGADLLIATDPDADRLGVTVRGGDGFVTFSGNQIGCILLEYIITALKRTGRLAPHAYAVKSFVSTELAAKIAKANGVAMYDVFTGFKYIGEKMNELEDKENGVEFILGFEESNGYLRGTYARDKDAVVAAMLVCEAAAHYASLGMTLYDVLLQIYEKYGHFLDAVDSVYMEGLDGLQRMADIMKALRADPPKELAGFEVTAYTDYAVPERTDLQTGEKTPLATGKNNTLYFNLGEDVVVIRPSGTEPKIKFYYMIGGKTEEETKEKLKKLKTLPAAITKAQVQ
ncbi:MAG: phospho-sugar mutase [Clostridia bacterium]|nr:phospho-sugar mutase [Clostridia bacterium]